MPGEAAARYMARVDAVLAQRTRLESMQSRGVFRLRQKFG